MSQPWTSLFQFNRMPLMEHNLQDITQEMADRAPAEGVNSITWILNHVVGTFFMHEAYHLGQIGTARKLMGLAGALKNPAEKVHA